MVGRVDLGLVLDQEGAEDAVVDGDSAVEGGDHEPEEEDGLEEEVEGEPVQEDIGEGLDDRNESVHGPVGQPLLVILLLGGLEGLEGTVGGVDEAEEVGEELAGKVEEDHQEDEGSGTEGQVGLGNTSGSLKLDQLGDLVQLLVELSDVVAG